MTTYTKETALYDTGAIGDDIEEAGTKADNYLTDVSGGGVMVHPSDDSTSGWKISSALELLKSGVSYIWAGLVNNIATVRIGKETGGHSVIDENGMRVYGGNDGGTQLVNIGYGDAQGESSIVNAPYYTLGVRNLLEDAQQYDPTSTYEIGDVCIYDGKKYITREAITTPEAWASYKWSFVIGEYSTAEGEDCISSDLRSHAEGDGTKAISWGAHAEGRNTIASGKISHAEGYLTLASKTASHAEGAQTKATGIYSHAEGSYTQASGHSSHAQNYRTIANQDGQTVIGRCNDNQSDTAFEIGNGEDDDNRSNALTGDWDGNVEAAGAFFSNGAEFSKKASNYIVIGGYHVCWGSLTVSSPTLNAYAEQTVTLPYTYTSAPFCIASCAGRAARHRTAYASQGDQTGNKIRVGYYATASGAIYINYLTIGV